MYKFFQPAATGDFDGVAARVAALNLATFHLPSGMWFPLLEETSKALRAQGNLQGTVVGIPDQPGVDSPVVVKTMDGKEQKFTPGELEKINSDPADAGQIAPA